MRNSVLEGFRHRRLVVFAGLYSVSIERQIVLD